MTVPLPATADNRLSNTPPKNKGRGRTKGKPNIATREMKEFIQRFLDSPRYRKNIQERILRGDANHIETIMWYHLYGKPRTVVEIQPPRGAGLAAQLELMSKAERAVLAGALRRIESKIIDVTPRLRELSEKTDE